MDSIEKAAAAIDASMNGPAGKGDSSVDQESSMGINDLFGNLGSSMEDEEGEEEEAPRKAKADAEGDPDVEDESDEDSEEESEEESDEDEEEEDDESDGKGLDMSAKVEITVDGQPEEVTLREALDGYIRTKTFNRRMSYLNEVTTTLAQEATNIKQSREKAMADLSLAQEQLKAILPAEPDWDALYATDPAQARKLETDYKKFHATIKEIGEKRDALAAQQAEDAKAEDAKFAKKEFSKFIEANPNIRTENDLSRELGRMRQTAFNLGFTEEEVSQVYDSRMLLILQKAARYDAIQAKKVTLRTGEPAATNKKTVKPGTGAVNGTVPKGVARAQRQLRRTGSIEDAAAALQRLI